MVTEYTDCAELMRLITEQKIKPAAIKSYLSKQGIIFTSINAQTFAEDVYTIFLGGQEMTNITQMIVSDGNYEKSTLGRFTRNYTQTMKRGLLTTNKG